MERTFHPISRTLIRHTMTAAVVCTLVVGLLKGVVTVREENAAFERALRNIAETNVPLLSVSIWDIEPRAVEKQVNHIASHPQIAHVRLTDRTGHMFEAGSRSRVSTETPKYLEIPYPDGRPGSIATLQVTADRATLYAQVAQRVMTLVASYALLAAVMCGIIAAVLRLELERPMRDLTRFTAELTPGTLTRPLRLSRRQRPWRDEIDQLAHGFRTLQDGIHAHVANLDALVSERTRQLESALDEIRALTITDSLTGCYNRRYLDERLREEVLRSQRFGHALSVIVLDIDHFKQVNDRYGHPAGDAVLKGVAKILQAEMRARIDWVARLGGEEFVALLPDTQLDEAAVVAERLRGLIAGSAFRSNGDEIRVTASFGVATRVDDDSPELLLARADANLYRAKAARRNIVIAA